VYEPPPFSSDRDSGHARGLPRTPVRLSPLSSIVYVTRAAVAFVYVAVTALVQKGSAHYTIDLVILVLTVAGGITSWAVTRWFVEGSTLQVSTGLIRRKVVRVPLSRVQAVDLVEPWVARLVGLAEVRVRTGGGADGDARLQYLRVSDAQATRNALIALAHGLPPLTPEAQERPLVRVDNGLLVRSTMLTGRMLSSAGMIAVEILLAAFHLAIAASSLLLYVFAMASTLVRRVANEWGLAVSESPDGLRVKTGVGSRLRETIPVQRIQALHRIEPVFWRHFGWQRLELHLAGGVARRRRQTSAVVRRALLPVGLKGEADLLVGRLVGVTDLPLERPPGRGRLRSPLSFHFLAAGHDATLAVSTWGRLTRRTELMPLAKVQSIHYVQGPILRMLGLATVRMHAAGRGATVTWRQWDAGTASALVDELTAACAAARKAHDAALAPRGLAGEGPAAHSASVSQPVPQAPGGVRSGEADTGGKLGSGPSGL
jgi:putative membrane protein